jgi:hypothetical protein
MRLRGQDTDRLMAGGIAIAIAIALAVVLAFVARGVNRPPVIAKVEPQPAVIARDGSTTVRVAAEDPDADKLKYEYKADFGKIEALAGQPGQARYAPAPDGPKAVRVDVTVTDARGLTSKASTLITVEGDPAPAPTEEPTPQPTDEPAPMALITPLPTKTPKPTRTPPPPPTSAPVVAAGVATPAPQRVNRPPVLQEGSTISELGANPIVLVATGHEPDGEPITFSWDPGPCLEIQNPTQFEAEVKLIGECSYAVATLTWTDPQGASAQAQWTINR